MYELYQKREHNPFQRSDAVHLSKKNYQLYLVLGYRVRYFLMIHDMAIVSQLKLETASIVSHTYSLELLLCRVLVTQVISLSSYSCDRVSVTARYAPPVSGVNVRRSARNWLRFTFSGLFTTEIGCRNYFCLNSGQDLLP